MQGKAEADPDRVTRLLAEIQYDSMTTPAELLEGAFTPLDVDEREIVMAKKRTRVGQGTFRARLLDAAHIQPYLGPASNHVQNGLLLTKEFHALFDSGYVTVTPDYTVRVSEALREDWDNGVRYYPFDGRPLVARSTGGAQPSREALEWHGQRVFKG